MRQQSAAKWPSEELGLPGMGAGDHVHGQEFYDRVDYEHKGFDEGRVPDCLARVGSPRAKARRHEFQELAIRTGGLRPSYQSGLDCVGADCHLSVVSGVVSDLRVLCRCRMHDELCGHEQSLCNAFLGNSQSRMITCDCFQVTCGAIFGGEERRVLRAPERFLRQLLVGARRNRATGSGAGCGGTGG